MAMMPVRVGPGSRVQHNRGCHWIQLCLFVLAMQTSLIQNAHADLVTDAAYDFYGVRLATCSLDHRIKIWQLDESDGTWTAVADWKVRATPPLSHRG